MPFDDDDADDDGAKHSGLKLSNKKSIFNQLPKKSTPAEFQQQVKQSQEKIMGYELEASQLAAMFQKLLEDKTLSENKNQLSLESERELISKIIDIAVKLNNDTNEQEGMGSVGISILLFRAVLMYKDRLNKLEFNFAQQEKQIKSLTEKLELLTVDNKKSNE